PENGSAGALVDEIVAVEGGQQLGRDGPEQGGGGRPCTEAGVDPALEADHEDGPIRLPGRSSLIQSHRRLSSLIGGLQPVGGGLRRLGQAQHLVGKGVDPATVTAHGPTGVASVDAFEDAGELPVAEGYVEVELREVSPGPLA